MEEIKINIQGKVLEVNKKAIEDSINFFKELSEKSVNESLKNLSRLNHNELDYASINFFSKGKKLWLEVTVEDSYMSHFLFKWIYDQDRPYLMGCSIDSIHFSMPSEFTEDEKMAIRELYKRVIGE